MAKEQDRTEQVDSLAGKNTKIHDGDLSGSVEGDVEQTFLSAQPQNGQAGKPAPQELSDPVKALLGLDGKVRNYPELLQAIGMLKTDLSAADVAALRDMLMFPNDQFPEKMRAIEINAVKNDVLDKLLRQTELSEGLGLQMAEMAADPDNDPVWRDYCIQFMEPFYDRASGELDTKNHEMEPSVDSVSSSEAGGEHASVELMAVKEAMFSALDERSETIAGTSLIGLELLSRTHEEFDRELIIEKTVEIASDEQASTQSRLTALRLSAQISNNEQGISNDELAGVARSLAQMGETVLLRSAAIVTLGEVGTADDRELLESFTFSENKQIAAAAQMALKKMEDQDDPAVEPDVAGKTITEPEITKKAASVLIN